MAATVKAGAKRPRTANANGNGTAPPAPQITGPLRFSAESDEPEEREPLFFIDDHEYTIPVNPPASIALEALHIMAAGKGSVAASIEAEDYIMTEMLGEDGWAALRGCKTVKKHEMRHLIQVISERANSAMEDDGNPNR